MSDEATDETPPKKGKPILLIIIAANVVLGGGAGAFFFLRGGGDGDAHAKPAAHGEDQGEHGASKGDHGPPPGAEAGPVVDFKPVLVNLNEPEGTRYLKATVSVQLVNEKATAQVEKRKAAIRDHFIRALSELNFRQTMGTKNKLAIKQKLLEHFNDAVGAELGTEVHFVQFVVQ